MQESFDWIVKCINGCTNSFQLTCCYTLLDLFKIMYKEQSETSKLSDQLLLDIRTKEIEISITA